MGRALGIFVAVTFGFSWLTWEAYVRWVEATPLGTTIVKSVFMLGPALGAIAGTRWGLRQPLATLGPAFRLSPWLLVACLAPIVFVLLTTPGAALLPGVSLVLDSADLREQILVAVPEQSRDLVAERLVAMGPLLPLTLMVQVVVGAVLAGPTINAVVALGEELGWRGFLHHVLLRFGFWRGSFGIGLLWGVWHAPLVLRGHNYPEHPRAGVLLMTLFCVLLAPLFSLLRERAGSILAPCIMHGTLNAMGGLLLFVDGGGDLLAGPTGAAGLSLLAVCNLALWRLAAPAAR